jgi:thiol-disulfide isomerase/thioredoxin
MGGKMSERIAFRGLIVLFLASVLAVYAIVAQRDNAAPGRAAPEDPYRLLIWHAEPQALPDQSVTGPDGAPVTLAAFKGRAVLLNLWASWCPPCIEEMPALSRLQAALGGPGFTVLAVDLDIKPEDGRQWLAVNHIANLAFHHDEKGKLFDALKAPGLPLSVFIDKEGREVGRIAGSVPWDAPRARALIAKIRGSSDR